MKLAYGVQEETCQLSTANEQKSESQHAVQNEETTFVNHPYLDGETEGINPTNDTDEKEDVQASHTKEYLLIGDGEKVDQEVAKVIDEAKKTQLLRAEAKRSPLVKTSTTWESILPLGDIDTFLENATSISKKGKCLLIIYSINLCIPFSNQSCFVLITGPIRFTLHSVYPSTTYSPFVFGSYSPQQLLFVEGFPSEVDPFVEPFPITMADLVLELFLSSMIDRQLQQEAINPFIPSPKGLIHTLVDKEESFAVFLLGFSVNCPLHLCSTNLHFLNVILYNVQHFLEVKDDTYLDTPLLKVLVIKNWHVGRKSSIRIDHDSRIFSFPNRSTIGKKSSVTTC
ncbi:hypothetical protein CR513_32751, partial [Mucuna pruriens]